MNESLTGLEQHEGEFFFFSFLCELLTGCTTT